MDLEQTEDRNRIRHKELQKRTDRDVGMEYPELLSQFLQ